MLHTYHATIVPINPRCCNYELSCNISVLSGSGRSCARHQKATKGLIDPWNDIRNDIMMECYGVPPGVAVTCMGHPDPIITIANSFVRFKGMTTYTLARVNAYTQIRCNSRNIFTLLKRVYRLLRQRFSIINTHCASKFRQRRLPIPYCANCSNLVVEGLGLGFQ
jgi:hypothetical protein